MKIKALPVLAATLFALPLLSSASFANEQSDQVYNSARNQLGMIKYCAENGHLPAEAVAAFEKIVAVLPVASDKAVSDKYEAEGVAGNSYDGIQVVSLKDISAGMGSSIADYCATYKSLIAQ